ncbi:hypothetical protein L915_19765 [Phytophthora nicotianae]|uniref:Uncharacterized protein n=1 Tax=Phytophthora nicotianae TaxID=4792 RepID=W2FR81_PHYNI|nr:hypothetical protein L915_19765 [Phytophthora nicotianae]
MVNNAFAVGGRGAAVDSGDGYPAAFAATEGRDTDNRAGRDSCSSDRMWTDRTRAQRAVAFDYGCLAKENEEVDEDTETEDEAEDMEDTELKTRRVDSVGAIKRPHGEVKVGKTVEIKVEHLEIPSKLDRAVNIDDNKVQKEEKNEKVAGGEKENDGESGENIDKEQRSCNLKLNDDTLAEETSWRKNEHITESTSNIGAQARGNHSYAKIMAAVGIQGQKLLQKHQGVS